MWNFNNIDTNKEIDNRISRQHVFADMVQDIAQYISVPKVSTGKVYLLTETN